MVFTGGYEDMSAAPIAGEVNHDFTTPFLTGSTTYYATALNGACESDFAQLMYRWILTLNSRLNRCFNMLEPGDIDIESRKRNRRRISLYENAEDEDPVAINTSGLIHNSITICIHLLLCFT